MSNSMYPTPPPDDQPSSTYPTPPPDDQPSRPISETLYDEISGRIWSRDAVDRFIIGYKYCYYTNTHSCFHLSLAYPSFASLTNSELDRFLQAEIRDSEFWDRWEAVPANDADVRQVMRKIKRALRSATGDNVARRDGLFHGRGIRARR